MRFCIAFLFFLPQLLQAQTGKAVPQLPEYKLRLIRPHVGINSSATAGYTKPDTLYYSNRKIKAIGYYSKNEMQPGNGIRTGYWLSFYENGQLKSAGTYGICSYWICSSAVPQQTIYSYKTGEWTYYHDNGTLKAKGFYQAERLPVYGGIAGQYAIKSYTTGNWIVLDATGKAAENPQDILETLNIEF